MDCYSYNINGKLRQKHGDKLHKATHCEFMAEVNFADSKSSCLAFESYWLIQSLLALYENILVLSGSKNPNATPPKWHMAHGS